VESSHTLSLCIYIYIYIYIMPIILIITMKACFYQKKNTFQVFQMKCFKISLRDFRLRNAISVGFTIYSLDATCFRILICNYLLIVNVPHVLKAA
jgi:uncharacterized integral membrane protein